MQIPLTTILVLSSCLAIGEVEKDKEQHKLILQKWVVNNLFNKLKWTDKQHYLVCKWVKLQELIKQQCNHKQTK